MAENGPDRSEFRNLRRFGEPIVVAPISKYDSRVSPPNAAIGVEEVTHPKVVR
jgi:hypothetical protein